MKRILYVDSNSASQALMVELLRNAECRLVQAGGVEEAQEILESGQRFDIIICRASKNIVGGEATFDFDAERRFLADSKIARLIKDKIIVTSQVETGRERNDDSSIRECADSDLEKVLNGVIAGEYDKVRRIFGGG